MQTTTAKVVEKDASISCSRHRCTFLAFIRLLFIARARERRAAKTFFHVSSRQAWCWSAVAALGGGRCIGGWRCQLFPGTGQSKCIQMGASVAYDPGRHFHGDRIPHAICGCAAGALLRRNERSLADVSLMERAGLALDRYSVDGDGSSDCTPRTRSLFFGRSAFRAPRDRHSPGITAP